MVDDATIRAGSALRERRRVLLFCAPVTLLFTFADTLALQRFSPPVFALRLLWAGLIVATALALGRVSSTAENRLTLLLGVASSLFFAVITVLTGGYASPLFHWILAMPLVIAVVLQEYPRATTGAALTTVASGLFIIVRAGQPPAVCVQWAVLASGMSALAVYASVTYRRLRFREQALRESAAVATDRARSSQQAVQARDEFLAIAGHELRTPMTALVINSERLLRHQDSDNYTARTVESMHRQIGSMAALVERLLDVSRLGAGTPLLELSPTDLGAMAEQVVQRYQATAELRGCSIALERLSPGPVLAAVDRTRFDQILTNLVVNALKFGAGKPVTVSVAAEGGRARVSVCDRGVGIGAADQERIFHRFERISATDGSGGLGLGLWISRRLIEEMSGRILVDSRPNEGATFTVDLPLGRAIAANEPAPAPPPS